MSWIYLIIAGLFEVSWAIGLKYTEGFSKLVPSFLTIMAMLFSFYFLSLALRTLPLGTGYAVWTGIGTMGTALFGILYINEPATVMRILSFIFILIGMIGLKMAE